ncbi:unnamed protein product [Clonostachys chloroleuca]|uniref:Uncharacterized protein n=1 Tax=Clonostachys chloroleuca TaxID=1926264 RepID=A0AA35LTH1_9HYPO|nr:unnamed protein product [Clonostachys chloroleuca]
MHDKHKIRHHFLLRRWHYQGATTSPRLKSLDNVVADARDFANSHGMPEHAELFGRAALVAREMVISTIPELTNEELHALQYEKDHKWHRSKMLWYSIGLCAVGAATQGWDQTGAGGANLSFPKEFSIYRLIY